ncbi:MAG: serine protease SohB [Arenicella sp.]|jgi:serine protease SohB
MSEFFFSYGLFVAKIVTGLIALVFAVAIVGGGRKKDHGPSLKVTNLNDKYNELKSTIQQSLMDKKEYKALLKSEAKDAKKDKKSAKVVKPRPKLFVLEFEGDIHASGVETMREEITALLSVAEPQDEVLMKLDNSGGAVHEHGLASSQLQRINDAKLNFTVSVDRVAASGGYMMACVADKIVAAPFAIVGSIGVVAQLPNFHRLLDRVGVDWEQHTAGEYKRTVTMFGENGEKEREKLKLELQETHVLFRDFVAEHRPKLDVDKVSTGEHWYGKQALELNLVDELVTSDEYLVNALDQFDIYEINMEVKQGLQDKLLGGLFASFSKVRNSIASSEQNSKYK